MMQGQGNINARGWVLKVTKAKYMTTQAGVNPVDTFWKAAQWAKLTTGFDTPSLYQINNPDIEGFLKNMMER